jgi:hypothetical protein
MLAAYVIINRCIALEVGNNERGELWMKGICAKMMC